MAYVYILRCKDNSYYTGYALDLQRRLQEHQQGQGSKYTRGRRPVQLVYWEQLPNKSEAMQREYQIKQLNRLAKDNLINNHKNDD